MKTISNNTSYETIINKSKFICLLYKVNDKDDVKKILEELKEKYKDATHLPYAYILKNEMKFSDDKEPVSTAGKPILNVLEKNELCNVLGVVVRYFGGIKLGAGGLTRAYSKSVTNALTKIKINEIKEAYKIIITFEYEKNKAIDILLKNETIINKSFNDTISYEFIVEVDRYLEIYNALNSGCLSISILEKTYI